MAGVAVWTAVEVGEDGKGGGDGRGEGGVVRFEGRVEGGGGFWFREGEGCLGGWVGPEDMVWWGFEGGGDVYY